MWFIIQTPQELFWYKWKHCQWHHCGRNSCLEQRGKDRSFSAWFITKQNMLDKYTAKKMLLRSELPRSLDLQQISSSVVTLCAQRDLASHPVLAQEKIPSTAWGKSCYHRVVGGGSSSAVWTPMLLYLMAKYSCGCALIRIINWCLEWLKRNFL